MLAKALVSWMHDLLLLALYLTTTFMVVLLMLPVVGIIWFMSLFFEFDPRGA